MSNNIIRFDYYSSAARVLEEINKPEEQQTRTNSVSNKKPGVSSRTDAIDFLTASKMLDYFEKHEMWLTYLLFVVSCNTARRNCDIMSLRWNVIYNPATGSWWAASQSITEQKTKKFHKLYVNQVIRDAIQTYIAKTGCDPSKNNYNELLCMQLTGNYKGRPLSYSAYYKQIKKAASAVGAEGNIGTHSQRKMFGSESFRNHPNDPYRMQVLQSTFNHSSESITSRYIGLDEERQRGYFDDFGDNFNAAVINHGDVQSQASNPIVVMERADLRDIIAEAYRMGMKNSGNDEAESHIKNMNQILALAESLERRY